MMFYLALFMFYFAYSYQIDNIIGKIGHRLCLILHYLCTKLREIKNIVIHEQEYYDAARRDADMQLYW